jgi:bacteriorhodopsin
MIFSVLGMDMEKVSDTDAALFKAAIAGIPVFLIAIIVLLVSIIRNKRSGDRGVLIVRSALLSVCVSIIAYFVLNVVMGVKCSSADTYIVIKFIIPLIKTVCYLTLLSTIISTSFIIRAWINGRYLLRTRVLYSITAIFAIINLIFMYVMNGFIL